MRVTTQREKESDVHAQYDVRVQSFKRDEFHKITQFSSQINNSSRGIRQLNVQ